MHVWIIFMVMVAILHDSALQSGTDFTMVENTLILMLVVRFVAFQIFLSCWKADLALPIDALTSASIPLWLLMTYQGT